MSEDMPKVWWSPSEREWCKESPEDGGFYILDDADLRFQLQLPADAVELKPVSDAPVAPVEAAKRVKAFLDNRDSLGGDEITTSYAAGAFKHGLRVCDLRALIEWQEVTDDV